MVSIKKNIITFFIETLLYDLRFTILLLYEIATPHTPLQWKEILWIASLKGGYGGADRKIVKWWWKRENWNVFCGVYGQKEATHQVASITWSGAWNRKAGARIQKVCDIENPKYVNWMHISNRKPTYKTYVRIRFICGTLCSKSVLFTVETRSVYDVQ